MTEYHRIADALTLAIEAHDGQVRKTTDIPYISHPIAVASLVLEYGGSENQVIAGLLHDAIEDGGSAYRLKIAARFGAEVLALVEACSDGTAESKAKAKTQAAKKADWKRRKLDYLHRLETEDPAALLVTACDKLHNARAIVADLERIGLRVFDRFTAGREGTLWYYGEVGTVLSRRESPVANALADIMCRMKHLAIQTLDARDIVRALEVSLNANQRADLKKLVVVLADNAQKALTVTARGLSEISAHQQVLAALQDDLQGENITAQLKNLVPSLPRVSERLAAFDGRRT